MVAEEGTKGVDENIIKVQETGKMIRTLGEVIQRSAMDSKQIVAAVKEESVGIDQMAESISQIDQVTKEFSKAAEQTKIASLSLGETIGELKKSVEIYKLKK